MHVDIHSQGFTLTPGLREYVRKRLACALARRLVRGRQFAPVLRPDGPDGPDGAGVPSGWQAREVGP